MKLDSNTVVFITGAGSGFGLECVIKFHGLGCIVVLADNTFTNCAQTFIKYADQSRILSLDGFNVTDEESIVSNLALAIDKFKRVDILINCAGVVSLGFTISGQTISNSEIWRLLKINLIGTINVSKYVARHMMSQKEQNDRVIINIASVAGLEGSRGMLAYAISMGGIIGMTLPMAGDLGKYNIRVVSVAPQIFNKPMGKLNSYEANLEMLANTPLGRLCEPKEFAQAAVSIAESSYLTGCVVRLDGGIRLPHI